MEESISGSWSKIIQAMQLILNPFPPKVAKCARWGVVHHDKMSEWNTSQKQDESETWMAPPAAGGAIHVSLSSCFCEVFHSDILPLKDLASQKCAKPLPLKGLTYSLFCLSCKITKSAYTVFLKMTAALWCGIRWQNILMKYLTDTGWKWDVNGIANWHQR